MVQLLNKNSISQKNSFFKHAFKHGYVKSVVTVEVLFRVSVVYLFIHVK